MAMLPKLTEADILEKVVARQAKNFSPATARDLLKFRFDRASTAEVRRLLQKNNRGTISGEERLVLERFLRVGRFLDLLHAKARGILQAHGDTP